MEIQIKKIPQTQQERITIECFELTPKFNMIVRYIKSLQGTLSGEIEDKIYEIGIQDIYYIEVVDDRTFLYTKGKVYLTRQKLYELEEALKEASFLRISKSVIVNLLKIKSLKPALNGRFSAELFNGESVIISRKYVPAFKEKIKNKN